MVEPATTDHLIEVGNEASFVRAKANARRWLIDQQRDLTESTDAEGKPRYHYNAWEGEFDQRSGKVYGDFTTGLDPERKARFDDWWGLAGDTARIELRDRARKSIVAEARTADADFIETWQADYLTARPAAHAVMTRELREHIARNVALGVYSPAEAAAIGQRAAVDVARAQVARDIEMDPGGTLARLRGGHYVGLPAVDAVEYEAKAHGRTVLGMTQASADTIIGSYGGLGEQLAHARKIGDPEIRQATESMIKIRWAEREAVDKKARDDASEAALGHFMAGGDLQSIDRGVWDTMRPTDRLNVLSHAAAMADKSARQVDWGVYDQLSRLAAEDPDRFGSINLMDHAGALGTEFKGMVDLQRSVVKSGKEGATARALQRTRVQMVDDVLRSIGVDPQGRKSRTDARRVEQLNRIIDDEIAARGVNTPEELTKLLDELTLKGVISGSGVLFDDTRYLFEARAEGTEPQWHQSLHDVEDNPAEVARAAGIPVAEVARLAKKMKAESIPINPLAMRRAWPNFDLELKSIEQDPEPYALASGVPATMVVDLAQALQANGSRITSGALAREWQSVQAEALVERKIKESKAEAQRRRELEETSRAAREGRATVLDLPDGMERGGGVWGPCGCHALRLSFRKT